jgi:hypothetical protein
MATQIGFSSRKGNILSSVIRWFTRSKISHCWLLLDDPQKGRVVLEAEYGPGIEETPWAWFPKDEVVALVTPAVPLEAGLEAAKAWMGEKYNVAGLFGMAWVMVWRWLHVKVRNPFRNSHEMFCSVLLSRVLQLSNYPGMEGRDPQSMEPEDVYELVTGKKF